MKTRVTLLSLILCFTALFSRAADPVIDALVAQIQANPSEAPAAIEQALATLTAGLSPEAAANVAASTTTAAIDAIPASTPADEKAKLVEAIIASAVKTVPGAEAAILKAAGKSNPDAAKAAKKKIRADRKFSKQRPPLVVSPSR
jgi:hypothetical protein